VPIVLTFLARDLGEYWFHRLGHASAFFWRFHQIHHLDAVMDVTTELRVHFVERLLQTIIAAGLILTLSLPAYAWFCIGWCASRCRSFIMPISSCLGSWSGCFRSWSLRPRFIRRTTTSGNAIPTPITASSSPGGTGCLVLTTPADAHRTGAWAWIIPPI
jgi:hypothetical protein